MFYIALLSLFLYEKQGGKKMSHSLSHKSKFTILFMSFLVLIGSFIGFIAPAHPVKAASNTLTVVFISNDSVKEVEPAREALTKAISKATGKKVQIQTTTDYNIAIQAIASGKAQLALLGPDGYIQARSQNKKVEPILTYSGKSGTLKDAYYHSYIMVPKNKAAEYKKDGQYSLDKIKGKKMAFVSNTSTSGFAVPAGAIKTQFKLKDTDQLSQNGKFFSKVTFAGSHQGSALSLLKGDVDVAAFDDMDLTQYGKFINGNEKPGSIFKVNKKAPAPFQSVPGKESLAIAAYEVQNEPLVANGSQISKGDIAKIQKALTAKDVTNDPHFFAPENAKQRGLFTKDGQTQFVKVTDSWYKPTHKVLGK